MNLLGSEIQAPWERLPTETDRSFGAFMVFLNMQAQSRSVDGAYRLFAGKEGEKKANGKSIPAPPYFEAWAKDNQWLARAAAWDAEIQRQAQAQAVREAVAENQKWARRREEMLEREWQQAQAIADKVDAMLALPVTEKILSDPVEIKNDDGTVRLVQYVTIKPANWKLHDVARMADKASTLQRRATQMANDIAAVEIRGLPGRTSNVPLVEQDGQSPAAGQPQTLGKANLPFDVAVMLARRLVAILTARFPEKPRAELLKSASDESGVPVALLIGEAETEQA